MRHGIVIGGRPSGTPVSSVMASSIFSLTGWMMELADACTRGKSVAVWASSPTFFCRFPHENEAPEFARQNVVNIAADI